MQLSLDGEVRVCRFKEENMEEVGVFEHRRSADERSMLGRCLGTELYCTYSDDVHMSHSTAPVHLQ